MLTFNMSVLIVCGSVATLCEKFTLVRCNRVKVVVCDSDRFTVSS